jgi:protoheme IX farnesyltransferase
VALTAAVLTAGLIVLGGVVRITGSGMGCGDHWPLCDGEWFPPLDLPTLIEVSHRWVAALLSAAVALLAWTGWRRHRSDPYLRDPALLAGLVLVVQVLLGPVIVKLDLPPAVVVVHLLNAMVLLAILVVAALRSGAGAVRPAGPPALLSTPTGRLGTFTAAFGFIVILFGALTANLHAGPYCLGFPLCAGTAGGPPASTEGTVHWLHRIAAFALLVLAVTAATRVSQRIRARAAGAPRAGVAVERTAWLVVGLTALQIAVAAAMVLQLFPPSWRALHLLVGTLLWAALVALVFRLNRDPLDEPVSTESVPAPAEATDLAAETRPSLLRDLVALTKPRIISLLLLTTVAPMFITGHGLPSPALVFWVVVGGYLMAGGANTINMWFDRDIDRLMARTRLRPIPAGRVPGWAALGLGLLQGAAAFGIFWYLVNPLAAGLALAGYLCYIFVYTIWLKRLSPQNIVIGGAAGAFPPLVGWTAVTGSLDLAAIYLFAIIFFWTPPHFWALALMKQQDYARAGIPMMPVVGGERYTKVQMLIYTVLLIPLTVMPAVFGALGLFYAAVALLLGGRLLWYALRLVRERGITPTAWQMYKYSLLYLALLFVAMGMDRAVPFGHQFEQGPVEQGPILILERPEEVSATLGGNR